jgi:hypothetical protein
MRLCSDSSRRSASLTPCASGWVVAGRLWRVDAALNISQAQIRHAAPEAGELAVGDRGPELDLEGQDMTAVLDQQVDLGAGLRAPEVELRPNEAGARPSSQLFDDGAGARRPFA